MKQLFQTREVSILSFNERVLQEAEDVRNPVMERLRFLGIFSSNMDEFFKVRVGVIHRMIELKKKGMEEVLDVVIDKARLLDERFRAAYDQITSELARNGMTIVNAKEVSSTYPEVLSWLGDYFREKVLPSLVPIIISKRSKFPQIKDGTLYFAVRMTNSTKSYAILDVPKELPRFVELPNGNIMFVDDVIRCFLDEIFFIFKYDRIEAYEFKISRDAELDMDYDFSEGYIKKMERLLKQRKGGRPVRLVYDTEMPKGLLRFLREALKVSDDDSLMGGGQYHNMKDLMLFPAKRVDLDFVKRTPAKHPVIDAAKLPMVDIINAQDLLLTYPYQSFDHVIRLLREAAIDPAVREIKMTIYRVARPSQVVNALINAAKNGKKVLVAVELQARFDEQHNITISEILQESGCKVIYGVPPMKVHSKLLLIRRGDDRYAGLATGNFNETTGSVFVDSMLLTADKRITSEVGRVFKYLESAHDRRVVKEPEFEHLLVSPFNVRRRIEEYVERETAKGKQGYIMFKVNHFSDADLIERVRSAAEAGVKIDLIVRTTHGVRPCENIRAISIVDRYLEHQRIYMFGRDEDRCIYMTSADLMERNLDRRIEVGFPILNPELKDLVSEMIAIQLEDDCKARILDITQSNHYVNSGRGTESAQAKIHALFQERANQEDKNAKRIRRTRRKPKDSPAVAPAFVKETTTKHHESDYVADIS